MYTKNTPLLYSVQYSFNVKITIRSDFITNPTSSSFNESYRHGNLASTDPSIPCDRLSEPFKHLSDEVISRILIFADNPVAASLVSRRFRDISQDGVLSHNVFNLFTKYIQEAIREKIIKLSPAPQLPVTAPQLHRLAYSILSQQLKDIGLDPAAIGFTELVSCREADRLIEAKNFCLFCSKIPGITVNTEILDSKEGILGQEKSCRELFNTLDLTAINFLNLEFFDPEIIDLRFFDPQSLNFEGLGLTRLPTEGLKGLTRLPTEIGQLTALQKLRLDHNLLTTLPESIGQLTALQTLDLGHNLLTTLPESIGQLTALQTLFLERNLLTTLPKSIGQLTALQMLVLFKNLLTALPESFRNLTALQWLDLSSNLLQDRPEACRHLAALQILRFQNNPRTDF